VLVVLALLGCGSSGSDGGDPQGAGSTGGSSSGGSGAGGGAATGGAGAGADRRPEECRFEPASATSPGSNPISSFVATWVDRICVGLAPCCDASSFDDAACRASYTSVLASFASADPAHVAYDPAAAQACLAEIETSLASCSQLFGGLCTKVMRGLLRDGEVCKNGRECASGTATSADGQLKCGVGPRVGLGAPCAVSCSLDAYGAYSCYGQPNLASTGRCYAEDGVYCARNGVPLGPNDGSGATCTAVLANGAACTSSLQCASGTCSGGTCGNGADVGGNCPCRADLVCIASSNTCQPGRALGQACDFADDTCAAGLSCSAGAGGVCECGGVYGSLAMPMRCEF
jgi:hypothetical protein